VAVARLTAPERPGVTGSSSAGWPHGAASGHAARSRTRHLPGPPAGRQARAARRSRHTGVFVLFVQILAVSRRNPLSRKAPRPCDIFSKHDLQTVDQKGISDPKRQNLHERYEYPNQALDSKNSLVSIM